MSARTPIVLLLFAATAGLFFSAFSTFDFVAHLDRQVHDLHCSFVPGVVEASAESEGCQVTLLSPYSSLFRTAVWGGIPISLPAMAVFAFLLFRGVDVLGSPPARAPASVGFLLTMTGIPLVASLIMGYIAMNELDAACKLCIGIYVSSAICVGAAIWATLAVRRSDYGDEPASAGPVWVSGLVQLAAFVTLPVLGYITLTPDFSTYVGKCGSLEEAGDPYDVMVDLDARGAGVPTIEVLDPLCPSCRALEERLGASGLGEKLHRRGVLFPLDAECNWNVGSSMHPGACAVSRAVLCADETSEVESTEVLTWAFAEQDKVIEATKLDSEAAARMAGERFPALRECIGSAEAESRLNKSLRWVVTNKLAVLTPQLYVAGWKICDEDTDLGLDFALFKTLQALNNGALEPVRATPRSAKKRPPPDEPVEARPRPKKPATAKKAEPEKADAEPTDEPTKEDPPDSPPDAKEEPAEEEPTKEEPAKEEGPKKLPSVEELPPPTKEEGE